MLYGFVIHLFQLCLGKTIISQSTDIFEGLSTATIDVDGCDLGLNSLNSLSGR